MGKFYANEFSKKQFLRLKVFKKTKSIFLSSLQPQVPGCSLCTSLSIILCECNFKKVDVKI